MTWAVSTKGARDGSGSFEVCAEEMPHMISWGWYGPNKIRIENAPFDESVRLAQIICDAMNDVAPGK
jgi:hypothetical protein